MLKAVQEINKKLTATIYNWCFIFM